VTARLVPDLREVLGEVGERAIRIDLRDERIVERRAGEIRLRETRTLAITARAGP
jgi:hypothetical protein